VTSLREEGPGTLHACLESQGGPRVVLFDVDGTLSLPESTYLKSNLTLDGLAGGRAVTLKMTADRRRSLILEGPISNVVIRGLRFEGEFGVEGAVEYDLLALDGEDGLVTRVLVERCTFVGATDGALDITGDVSEAVVRTNLFHGNPLTMLMRYGTRRQISLHRNVFSGNGERNPQIRGDLRTIDFVNNVVHDWTLTRDGYGTEIRNEPEGVVDGNFVGNAFLASRPDQGPGFTVFNYPGAAQGRLFVSDNLCRPACGVSSTASAPLGVSLPLVAWPSGEVGDRLLPSVGAPHRTSEDVAVVERVREALRAGR
jgi:hypothetical protein